MLPISTLRPYNPSFAGSQTELNKRKRDEDDCKSSTQVESIDPPCLKKSKIENSENPLCSMEIDPPAKISFLNLSREKKIYNGYGEYIVFKNANSQTPMELTKETYEKVYQIFDLYSPASIVNNHLSSSDRYDSILENVKKIDADLEIAFIPRSLYELIYIRKCIKEDVKNNSICTMITPVFQSFTLESFGGNSDLYNKWLEELKIRKCWHLCWFDDAGDNQNPKVKELAYRLNQAIVKKLSPSKGGFSFQEILQNTENEIEFLKTHHKNMVEEEIRRSNGDKSTHLGQFSNGGPTTNFGYEKSYGSIKPMGIRDEADSEIIRKAIAVECSESAQKSFLLYRGANLKTESITDRNNENIPYSLSYGSGLFAGCLYDGGATPFHYMRNSDAYIISVPFDKLNDSPFYIPPTNALVQLSGEGEIFHARTKAWKSVNVYKELKGMNIGGSVYLRDHLMSNLTREELISQFETYKKKAILLK